MSDTLAPWIARIRRQPLASGPPIDDATCERLAAYAALLVRHAAKTNLVGTREPDRVVDELLMDSLQIASLLSAPEALLDVGSGAGIPGIPLAILWPEARVTLVEPRLKRASFLGLARRTLGLENVSVAMSRLDALDDAPGSYALAVSRAVFPPSTWLQQAAPWVRADGHIAVWVNGDRTDALQACDLEATANLPLSHTYQLGVAPRRTVLALASSILPRS